MSSSTPTLNIRRRRTRWGSLFFFIVLHAAAFIGAPWYVLTHGIAPDEAVLFAVYAIGTVLAIGVGYHRLFSHVAFKASPIVRFVVLFFGAATFEQSALKWSSQHRRHHLHVDTELDPYNIKSGFWYAHMGWILFWKHPVSYDNVRDLQKSRLIMHQHDHYQLWALGAGIGIPLAIGAAFGHVLGAFFLSVALRMTLVFHVTFFINSYAHTFGTATYDHNSSARDHWLGAVLTNGEGYHNFHHRFPSDYRNGLHWYAWDPSKWVIWALSRAGLAKQLNRTPPFQILKARLQADRDRAGAALQNGAKEDPSQALSALGFEHEKILQSAAEWESAVKRGENGGAEERRFKSVYRRWTRLTAV